MKEAFLYEKLENKSVHCHLCSHHCKIAEQKFGFCGVRQNIGGILYSLVFNHPCALHVDPIEKKPLYHFLPGTNSFSIATVGCNFRCGFCQNWEISQDSMEDSIDPGSEEASPQEIVNLALKNNCKSISYTYTEPTIFFEYAYETAKIAKTKGLYNIFVSNGYMTKEALGMIRPYLDAANVDLKFFNDNSYKKICAASLGPVLDSIKLMKELGIWVEVTTLVVPQENDSDEELRGIAGFIASVDKDMPWHISRFHPDYKFNERAATSEDTLKRAEGIGRKQGLRYVYPGNVIGLGNNTYCPHCEKLLIEREIFRVLEYNIKDGKCSFCKEPVAGIFA
ncbi:MAG: AmmeMemoRadiSam system radical SAM enzyme [Candidatus Omnitrophica bacterium]|nr:AmmeMemoRadiSam system radical SAM enzyme [Candidatus Omnitrophota bacterium]